MGIRPNREPPQERVQILSVTPKAWAEKQGISVADHWLMAPCRGRSGADSIQFHPFSSSRRQVLSRRCTEINHRHTTTLPREDAGHRVAMKCVDETMTTCLN